MGASKSVFHRPSGLDKVVQRAQDRVGVTAVSGRYHRQPKKLEDSYDITSKVLGSGYNGQVFLAQSKQSPDKKYAVKGLKLIGVPPQTKQDLESEIEIFLGMDHPHVARLVDVFETRDKLHLVMECIEGGELLARIQKRKQFTERDAALAAHHMLLAINYMHCHQIVHRDIKLENFLYQADDSDQLKLIDFGFSKVWEPNTPLNRACGTLSYVAPEVLNKHYDLQCDLWSVGVCVFILLLGYMPFAGPDKHQRECIKRGNYLRRQHQFSKLSADADNFITSLLVVDPKQRMDSQTALAHAWLANRYGHLPQSNVVDEDIALSLTTFSQATTFRRTCMFLMAWSLSCEERAEVEKEFLAFDKDNSGTISMAEFKQVLEDLYHIDDEEVKKAFDALDLSHQHEIHYSEFLAAMVTSRIHAHDDLLYDAFKRFDKDDNGVITKEDLQAILGKCINKKELDDLMKEVDTSHDGKISYQEFISYVKHSEADEKHAAAADRLIDHLRESTDGSVGMGSARVSRLPPSVVRRKPKEKSVTDVGEVSEIENSECPCCATSSS